MSPPQKKICVGGGFDGGIISGPLDEQQCRRQEGAPTPMPDAGTRITTDLPADYLRSPVWNAARLPGA